MRRLQKNEPVIERLIATLLTRCHEFSRQFVRATTFCFFRLKMSGVDSVNSKIEAKCKMNSRELVVSRSNTQYV